ncbi:MAG: tetratricopeptide repeat protein [Planctomycetia bacterium]|nr:tetratricopeptide repeat protein [Planctomycetia bacterium]
MWEKSVERRRHCWVLSLSILAGAVLFGPCWGTAAETSVERTKVLELLNPDVPAEFQPVLRARTVQEQDFLTAEEFFISGRAKEHAQNFPEALRAYERAWRYSESQNILRCIVPLAGEQNRWAEAARYFEKMEHPDILDVFTLRSIAVYYVETGQFSNAVSAYQAALRALPQDAYPALRVLLRFELGRWQYVTEDLKGARTSFEIVRRALERPSRFGLEENALNALKEQELFDLYLLADTYVMLGECDLAQSALEKAVALEKSQLEAPRNKDGSEKDVPKKVDLDKKLQELETKYAFIAAKIENKRKNLPQARQLVEKALELPMEDALVEHCSFYRELLEALNVENVSETMIPCLEGLFQKFPKNRDLRILLAQEYLMEDSSASREKSRELLDGLLQEEPTPEVCAVALQYAHLMQDGDYFVQALRTFVEKGAAEESFFMAFALWCAEYNKSEKDDQGNTSEDAQEPATLASDDSKDNADEEKVKKALVSILRPIFDRMQEKYPVNDPKTSWQHLWLAGYFARVLEIEDVAQRYYEAARVAIDKSSNRAQKDARSQFCLDAGNWHLEEEQYDKAFEFFQLGLKQKPKKEISGLFHLLASMAAIGAERHAAALEQLKQARACVPDNPALDYYEMTALVLDKKVDEARKFGETVIEKYDTDFSNPLRREILRQIRSSLSSLVLLSGEREGAEELLERNLDEFPDDYRSKNDIAYFWTNAGKNLERALRYAQDAIEAEPDNHAYIDTLAWAHYRLGNFDKAKELLEPIVAEMDDPVGYSHLADIYFALGEREKAVEHFKLALDKFDESAKSSLLVDPKEREHVETQLQSLNSSQGV